MVRHHIESYRILLNLLWETKTWRLLALIFLQLVGQLLLLPLLPTWVTNDFASRRAGEEMHCDEFKPSDSPASCQDAHADVVQASTISGFFQNTVFSILVSPALGAWSDVHGRVPVILMSQFLSTIPITVVIMNLHGILPMYWLYVVQAFTGSISLIAPSLAYISDVIDPDNRAAAFGLILASFSVAVVIGPPIGAKLDPMMAPYVTLAIIALASILTYLFLPESVNSSESHRAREALSSSGSIVQSTWRAISILKRNSLFIKLTLILMFTAVVSEGLQDILIQYLQLKMGFNAKDVSQMFMLLGAGALLVQGVLLQLLLKLFGEARLLCLGLFMSTLQQSSLIFATKKWEALGAVFLGSFTSVTFPTISSIKANNSAEHEQGSVQGALYGARSFFGGVGPLAFAYLFKIFSASDSTLPYFPGAPFVLGAIMMFLTTALAWSLSPDAGGNAGTLFCSSESKNTSSSSPRNNLPKPMDAFDLEEELHLLAPT